MNPLFKFQQELLRTWNDLEESSLNLQVTSTFQHSNSSCLPLDCCWNNNEKYNGLIANESGSEDVMHFVLRRGSIVRALRGRRSTQIQRSLQNCWSLSPSYSLEKKRSGNNNSIQKRNFESRKFLPYWMPFYFWFILILFNKILVLDWIKKLLNHFQKSGFMIFSEFNLKWWLCWIICCLCCSDDAISGMWFLSQEEMKASLASCCRWRAQDLATFSNFTAD